MKSTVIDQIVNNDLCIGCGVCAGICPEKVLEIQENKYGEYIASKIQDCSSGCSLCLKVCPFADYNENEDTIGDQFYGTVPGIMHTVETGYYLASYVGYSERHRLTSASGGMATWILETLLINKLVDHVICVASNDDPEKLFAFKIFDTVKDVREGAGSAYYPVEISDVIDNVLSTSGKYAIIGLPCFIKAIRNTQQINKKLRERIVLTVGLACSQMKSKHYTSYLVALSGIEEIATKVCYRGKDPEKSANNYYFSCKGENKEEKRIFWDEGVSEVWLNRWFTLNACNYCDDIFAECADVTCMDAWLPTYSQDYRGTNLVLVRSPHVWKIIEEGRKNREAYLEPISIQEIIKSQAGGLITKRKDLTLRLHMLHHDGRPVPRKRVSVKKRINLLEKIEISNIDMMQANSRELYFAHFQNGGECDIANFRENLLPYIRKLTTIRSISMILNDSRRIIRRATKR